MQHKHKSAWQNKIDGGKIQSKEEKQQRKEESGA